MTGRTMAGYEPILHKKMCADEDEVGGCFFCNRWIRKGQHYVLVVRRNHSIPRKDMAVGICPICARTIGEYGRAIK